MPNQAAELGDPALARFSARIASRMGLYFPPERFDSLRRGVLSASAEFGFGDPAAFIEWIEGVELTKELIERLASHLTVGETYFFRDPALFAAIEREVLPGIISKRMAAGEKRIRVWSAGCASGEEPYTLAIVLRRLLGGDPDWNLRILATDINAAALKRAAAGRYGNWSFRGVDDEVKRGYFRSDGGRLMELSGRIRSMVSFEYLNLADGLYPSVSNGTNAMDLIICRNVLMYMEPETARRAVAALSNSLVDGGWLALSPAEAGVIAPAALRPVTFPDAILYRKEVGEAGRADAPVLAAAELMSQRPEPAQRPRSAAHAKARGGGKAAREDKNAERAPASAASSALDEAAVLYGAGRYVEAAVVLEREFASTGDAASALMLARAYANAGRFDSSRQWCDRAMVLSPGDPAAHYLYAAVRLEEGEAEEAAAALRRAIYLAPDFALAYYMCGAALMALGRDEEAARMWGGALVILDAMAPDAVLPEGEGLTAGRLAEIIRAGAALGPGRSGG